MRLRRELLEYLRSEIGVVGSEAGGAWAVPYTDYFEGMAGSEIGVSIPLFDLVFHDAVLRQRHQGDGDLPGNPKRSWTHCAAGVLLIQHMESGLGWACIVRSFA